MPYATNNQISKHPIDGGIEISDKEYEQAKNHALSGGIIKTYNGKMVLTEKPEKMEGHEEPVWQGGDWYHEPKPEKTLTEEQINQERIDKLQQKLRDTDYVALPDYDRDRPEILAERQAWREEIRQLEQSL